MAIDYVWTFSQADITPQVGGLRDVVNAVHWRLTATDAEGVSESVYGSVGLLPPSGGSFIPFGDLTKEQVQDWVEARLNESKRSPRGSAPADPGTMVDKLKSDLAAAIAAKKAPAVVSQGFSFGA